MAIRSRPVTERKRVPEPVRRGLQPDRQDPGTPNKLPHERDESTDDVGAEPRPEILQAQKDLESGQVDTDLRATPGLDARRRGSVVKRGER